MVQSGLLPRLVGALRGVPRIGRAALAAVPGALPVAALVVLGLVLAGAGCGRRGDGPSILLVTLDTTRADRLGIYGDPDARTPVMDAWARSGVVARDAIADVPLTLPSHATLFTGVPALGHGVRTNADHSLGEGAETLAERLAAAGWATGAIVSSLVLERDTGIAQGFGEFDEELEPEYRPRNPERFPQGGSWLPRGDRRADAVAVRAEAWMDRVRTGEAPRAEAWMERVRTGEAPRAGGKPRAGPGPAAFLWAHFYDPHFPYDPPRPWIAAQAGDAYRAEIAFVDRELRGLWRRAAADGWLAVFVADHGEGLEDHREAEHGVFLYDELVRVPLGLAGPGIPAGQVMDAQVRTVDLASTLLALAGLAPLGTGQSFVPALRAGQPFPPGEIAYCETVKPRAYSGSPLKALRTSERKYVHAPRPELYDLRTDPREMRDRAAADPGRTTALRDELHGIVVALLAGGHANAADPRRDAADLEALESLGYVGGGDPSSADPATADDEMATPGFDPKDLVDVAMAGRDFENGFLEEADRKLDRFFATVDPEARREDLAPLRSLAWQNRAAVSMERGEAGRAADAYRRAIEAEPGNGAAHWGLLFALNRAGRPREAVREGERMLRETPEAWRLRLHWSLALVLAGDRDRARRELHGIVENSTDAQTRDVAAVYAAGLGGSQEEELIGMYLGSTR